MKRLALLAVAMLAPAASAAAREAPKAPLAVPGATFSILPQGWRRFGDGFGVLRPTGVNVESFATSWRYRLGSLHGPAGSLPRDGILVWVNLFRGLPRHGRPNLCRTTPQLAGYPLVRSLRLRMPRATTAILEGSPRTPEYRVFGRVGGSYDFELRVDIRNQHPPARLLGQARRVVEGIRLPRWPRRERC